MKKEEEKYGKYIFCNGRFKIWIEAKRRYFAGDAENVAEKFSFLWYNLRDFFMIFVLFKVRTARKLVIIFELI